MAQLTQRQVANISQWCQRNGRCFRLANQIRGGMSADDAPGCQGYCPVTGQNGGQRNKAAIEELVGLLAPAEAA